MAHVLNSKKTPMSVQIWGKKPTHVGQTETIWPAKTIVLQPGEPVQFDEDQATALAEKWEGQGLVKLKAGEDVEEASRRGREQRYNHYIRCIQDFRNLNASMAAQNKPLILPQAHHRALLKEIKEMQAEFAQDAVMTEPLPGYTKPEHEVKCVISQRQKKFVTRPHVFYR